VLKSIVCDGTGDGWVCVERQRRRAARCAVAAAAAAAAAALRSLLFARAARFVRKCLHQQQMKPNSQTINPIKNKNQNL
jgi:hypothetical protein